MLFTRSSYPHDGHVHGFIRDKFGHFGCHMNLLYMSVLAEQDVEDTNSVTQRIIILETHFEGFRTSTDLYTMPRLSFIAGGKKAKKMLRTGTLRKPRKLLSQDYQTLLEKCLRSKQLFADEAFPAETSSIGCGNLLLKLPPSVEWKRPQVREVFYYGNTTSVGDLLQLDPF